MEWTAFTNVLAAGARDLAADLWSDYTHAAQIDAEDFAATAKADIQRWSQEVAEGQITRDDFQDNVAAEAEIAQMAALTKVLAAQEEVQRFRDQLGKLIVSAALTALV